MNWEYVWWFTSPILGGLAGATVLAFARSYITRRGEHLATKHDLADLQNQLAGNEQIKSYFTEIGKHLATKHDLADFQKQLEENTEITTRIAQAHTREDVLWRSELEYRERQLSELYGPAYGYVETCQELYNLWMEGHCCPVNERINSIG
jgi:hypothetical protein